MVVVSLQIRLLKGFTCQTLYLTEMTTDRDLESLFLQKATLHAQCDYKILTYLNTPERGSLVPKYVKLLILYSYSITCCDKCIYFLPTGFDMKSTENNTFQPRNITETFQFILSESKN